MFMKTIRLDKKTMALAGVALALVLVLGVTGVRSILNKDATTAATATETAESGTKAKKVSAKTNEDRLAFVQSFGWEVENDPAEIMEVIIPEEFDEVYMQYNSIQKMQGYNLEDYAGKRCKRYSYTVTNYPGEEGAVRINLLVYKDKVVGGDVCSLDVDGFMHGFTAP